MRRHATALSALSAVLLGMAVPVALTAGPAQAATQEEIDNVPSGGTFQIEGHGWGHGHGMSQWGAQGGASLGKTADQITSFYYPNTTKAALANSAIRVLLQEDDDSDTQVFPATDLGVTDLSSGATMTLPSGPTRWRSAVDSAGLHLQGLVGSTWKPYLLGGRTAMPGPLQFSGPATIRTAFPNGTSNDFRGAIRSVRTTASRVGTVNVVSMESYLLGVVPRESSSSWKPAALQAQAIAARSYSAWKRNNAPSAQYFDICDTTQCQVYGGAAIYSSSGERTPLEATTTNQAVQATAGVIRTYNGKAIFAEFSSSNGGWSTDGGEPYLIAQQDDWDGSVSSTVHSWTATLTAAQLQARYQAVGTLKRIRTTLRDGNGEWGGRVKAVVLEGVDSAGKATSVTTTGSGVYNAHTWPASSDGLRGTWWHVKSTLSSAVTSQSAAPTLVHSPGVSTGTLAVTIKNTGGASWSTSGLHLAVASPPGQADPLVGGSTTPGRYTGTATTIAPNATATFSFALTGDGVGVGLQGRSYRLRNGAGALFGSAVSWQVPVRAPVLTAVQGAPPKASSTAPNNSAGSPGSVFADGRTVVVPVAGSTGVTLTARNTGNVTWPVGSAPVRLGTSNPRGAASPSAGSDWLGSSRPSGLTSTRAVPAGQNGTFALTLHGNGKPVGVTTESFEPFWEGRAWMGPVTPLTLVRTDPSKARLASLEAGLPSTIALTNAPNGTTSLTVRLRNLGGQPWSVAQERMGSASTRLSTTGWSSSTAPPSMAANASRPGQAKVYPGEIGEWRIPLSAARKAAGTYYLRMQAKGADGVPYGPLLTSKVTVAQAVLSGKVSRQAGLVNVPSNGTVLAFFEVKNTGNVAWPVKGPLRSEALASGGSPSHAASWISASRPSALSLNLNRRGATSVLPGEIGRFLVVLAGNGRTPRTSSEPFDVVWETYGRMTGVKPVLSYRVV
jgi:SpoIID/LytB domain protein